MKTKLDKQIELSKKRSMTKKALKAERNASRNMWTGIRPSVINNVYHREKYKQREKLLLKEYC